MGFPSILLICLLFVAAPQLVLGKSSPNLLGVTLNVTGLLACTTTGNPTPGMAPVGVPGALIILECGTTNTTLGQAITNLSGLYVIVVRLLDQLLFDPANCRIRVRLPIIRCAVFPPTGNLEAPVQLLNIVQSVLGLVVNLIAGPYTLVSRQP